VDGDTLIIEDAGGIRTRVRLRSINAPEMDEPGGPEAKAALEAELLGRRVIVTPHARDKYGRLVADVKLGF
jgi:endonuclease YncB( thermonuclease family)